MLTLTPAAVSTAQRVSSLMKLFQNYSLSNTARIFSSSSIIDDLLLPVDGAMRDVTIHVAILSLSMLCRSAS